MGVNNHFLARPKFNMWLMKRDEITAGADPMHAALPPPSFFGVIVLSAEDVVEEYVRVLSVPPPPHPSPKHNWHYQLLFRLA